MTKFSSEWLPNLPTTCRVYSSVVELDLEVNFRFSNLGEFTNFQAVFLCETHRDSRSTQGCFKCRTYSSSELSQEALMNVLERGLSGHPQLPPLELHMLSFELADFLEHRGNVAKLNFIREQRANVRALIKSYRDQGFSSARARALAERRVRGRGW